MVLNEAALIFSSFS